jgi:hypothetical protein
MAPTHDVNYGWGKVIRLEAFAPHLQFSVEAAAC